LSISAFVMQHDQAVALTGIPVCQNGGKFQPGAGCPGRVSAWAIRSVSITGTPSAAKRFETVVLPEPIPPVSPMVNMGQQAAAVNRAVGDADNCARYDHRIIRSANRPLPEKARKGSWYHVLVVCLRSGSSRSRIQPRQPAE